MTLNFQDILRAVFPLADLSLCAFLMWLMSLAPVQSQDAAAIPAPAYATEVQPIFNRRCIACHGCLGSPCNVKLDSFRGVDRGGLGVNPFDSHFTDVPRTDMDAANGVPAWRDLGFYPVLSRDGTSAQNLDRSLLYQMVAAGMRHNSPGFTRESQEGRRPARFAAQCEARPSALASYLAQNPSTGMPFGLPAISRSDFATLSAWIAAGAPGPDQAALDAARQVANPQSVADWEAFFNAPDPQSQLVSRFIFQHVFLATIILSDSPGDQFRLVRSSTPPADSSGAAAPVRIIATDMPYDDPLTYAGVDRFWYRLEKRTEPPVQKNHFLLHLDPGDIAHLTDLFGIQSGTGWRPGADLNPPYGIANPFIQFDAIPAEARSRFILENAETMVGGITYGPVCNGQTATYAVKDQFWVFFLDPASDPSVQDPTLGLDDPDALMDRSLVGNARYLNAFARTKQRLTPEGWSPDVIWNGDGTNPNAWLTVLRHETNVSVLQGARGGMPDTLWLLSYAGFERMYYDTVASFAYWAGDAEKLQTLLFFNLLRQDFQDHFLLLLPAQYRHALRDLWTRGFGQVVLAAIPFAGADQPARTDLSGGAPLTDIVGQIEKRLGPAISGLPDALNPDVKPQVDLTAPLQTVADFERAISSLTGIAGQPVLPLMPSVIVLRLTQGGAEHVYSLVANRAYASQYALLFQNGAALPDEDTLSVYPGLVNGFPNLFVDLDLDQAPGFLSALAGVRGAQDWQEFAARYTLARNSPDFWPFYDWLNAWNFNTRGDLAGWLDLTYYDVPEE